MEITRNQIYGGCIQQKCHIGDKKMNKRSTTAISLIAILILQTFIGLTATGIEDAGDGDVFRAGVYIAGSNKCTYNYGCLWGKIYFSLKSAIFTKSVEVVAGGKTLYYSEPKPDCFSPGNNGWFEIYNGMQPVEKTCSGYIKVRIEDGKYYKEKTVPIIAVASPEYYNRLIIVLPLPRVKIGLIGE